MLRFLFFCVLFDTSPPREALPALVFVTDASWKGAAEAVDGWTRPGFDDRAWAAADPGDGPIVAGAHYSPENMMARPTQARWIWAGDKDECSLRRTFDVRHRFRRAELLFAADDVAQIHVNGAKVEDFDTGQGWWGQRGGAELVDLTPHLVVGRNAIAVHVRNGGGPRGFAAELRVDGCPFIFPARAKAALPAGAAMRIRGLLGDPRLGEEVSRYGLAAAEAVRALAKEGRPGAEALLQDLDPDMSAMTSFALESVAQALRALPLTARSLLTMRAIERDNPDAFARAVRAVLKDGSDEARERAVRTISCLEIAALAPELADIVRSRPKTAAAAYATSALRRMRK